MQLMFNWSRMILKILELNHLQNLEIYLCKFSFVLVWYFYCAFLSPPALWHRHKHNSWTPLGELSLHRGNIPSSVWVTSEGEFSSFQCFSSDWLLSTQYALSKHKLLPRLHTLPLTGQTIRSSFLGRWYFSSASLFNLETTTSDCSVFHWPQTARVRKQCFREL